MAIKLGAFIGLIAALLCVAAVRADHNVYLPLVPNTPIIQQVIKAQEFTWCVDSRAAAYPSFVTQLRDVSDQYTARVGIKQRQVDYSDPACQVRHSMPDNHGCGSGCAAWVYYANWPVLIEYKWQLGYTDWRSAQGHELGHALLGLHEQYRDSSGSIACTGRQDTVMDCGGSPPVRYPQNIDTSRGCAIIATPWCGQAAVEPPPPPAEWCCDTVYPGWEGLGVSRLHVPSLTWYWGIPVEYKEFLYQWKDNGPWVCVSGCP